MSQVLRVVFTLLLLCKYVAIAENLFVSHYSGAIYTLSLTTDGNGTYTLATTSSIRGGGQQPSWLTWDAERRMLYSADEVGFGAGSISSFAVAANGTLTLTAKATAPVGAVHNGLYGGTDGRGFIASAH
jgi:6-phosphogluconolactonase (cycloisomerase 2 family)